MRVTGNDGTTTLQERGTKSVSCVTTKKRGIWFHKWNRIRVIQIIKITLDFLEQKEKRWRKIKGDPHGKI